MAKISGAARGVMAVLERTGGMARMGDGWRAGATIATARVAAELMRHDLARVADDRLVPTAAGAGFTVRAASPEGANRLLAERVIETAGRRARVTVNEAESPLGWLRARGMIAPRQFDAGERLRADYTTAALAPRVTMRWEDTPRSAAPRGPSGGIDATLAQIAAKRRMEAAMAAIGAGMGDIAWRTICNGEGLETAEKALGWPKRAGRLVLLMALDRLADHYSM